jgi:hypothetical protein
MRRVCITVEAYKYGEQPPETIDYRITLKPSYAIVEVYTPSIYGRRVKKPSVAKIKKEDFVYWVLSLNKKERKFLDAKLGNFMMRDFLTIVSYIFEEDFHTRLKAFEKAYGDEVYGVYERMSLFDLENLVILDKAEIEIKSWRDLMIRERPRMFHPHSVFYNPFFYHYRNNDIHKTKLIKSSTEDIEDFLNFLYETNPELIKKYVEKVEVDEDALWQYGYIDLHLKLRECIKEAWWSREVCLISASDTVRSRLKYDKECVEKLAKELELQNLPPL